MIKQNHIIQKQRYEIKTAKERTSLDIQNRLQELNNSHVLSLLAKQFDNYFYQDELKKIDKLELNLGTLKINATDNEWMGKINDSLTEQLSLLKQRGTENENGDINNVKTNGEHLVESWIWFLENGYLPADCIYSSVNKMTEGLEKISKSEKEILKNYLIGKADKNVIKRLVVNYISKIKKFHLQLLLPVISDEEFVFLEREIGKISINEIPQNLTLPASPLFLRLAFWNTIFNFVITVIRNGSAADKEVFEKITELVKTSNIAGKINIKETNIEKQSTKKRDDSAGKFPPREDGIYVPNAGLCLLAPYLASFFEEADLTDEKIFFDSLKQEHAVYLLHYLVTKDTEPTEELLVFPKLLCGWPVQMPCINPFQITEIEKKECDELLISVIQNWPALKNTSPDGLRESFLQRSGKLTEREEQFVLIPEQQSIDVLLEFIPWSFHIVRLPWMKKPVIVEWF